MRKIIRPIILFATFMAGLLLVVCIAAAGIFAFFNSAPDFSPDIISSKDGLELEPPDGKQIVVLFEVRKGESSQSVGRRLADVSLIRNTLFWNMLGRFSKEHIKAGTYRLEVPSNQVAIRRLLESGLQVLHKVTISEGSTIGRSATILEEAGICSAADFIAAANDPQMVERYHIPGESMEGYLFPETYLFPLDFPAARVVQTLADTFFSRLASIDEGLAALPPGELDRLVTLASIIEREYRRSEEAPVMAGVFLNRLNIGMALQSCATVEYIITEIQGKPHPKVIFYQDLEIRNPYNTYLHPGLPPGPISSPGPVALRAAMHPSQTNFLYFRLIEPSSGKHYFSSTMDEHIQAGTLYVKDSP